MSHNIDQSNSRANIAFLGSRQDIWHRMGQEMLPGQPIDVWAKEAGLAHDAILVPAIAALNGPEFDHIEPAKRFVEVPGKRFIARSDTGAVLGIASDGYQVVQPKEVLEWFERYISVDDRFILDVAGSLRGGAIIWATAKFNGETTIGGDSHISRVLMSTSYDTTRATENRMTTTRVICNNTFDVANTDGRAVVRTTHRSKFDAAKVGRELAALAQGVAQYKKVGDALAANEMSQAEVSEFFKAVLDIPFDVKKEDISTRKQNQFADLSRAFTVTRKERNTNDIDAWSALQAVTRYVDHDRASRGSDGSEMEKRFASSQFGSGAQLKGKAMALLLPRVKDLVTIAA
jgi:phage/plasmid-like protein (TIGR03299 family)